MEETFWIQKNRNNIYKYDTYITNINDQYVTSTKYGGHFKENEFDIATIYINN